MTSILTERTRARGRRYPGRPVRGINWASPLAQGLVFAVHVFGRNTSIEYRDLVRGIKGTPSISWGTFGSTLSRWGIPSPLGDFGADYIDFDNGHWMIDPAYCTYEAIVQNDTDSFRGAIFGASQSGHENGLMKWNTGVMAALTQGASSNKQALGSTNVGSSPTHAFARFRGSASRDVWVNGIQDGSNTDSNAVTGSWTRIRVGARETAVSQSTDGQLPLARAYDRALPNGQIIGLTHYPWDVYRFGDKKIFLPAAAAGGGSTTDVPLTTFSVSPQAPTTLRSLISNVPTL